MMYPSLPGVKPHVFVVADAPCVFKQSNSRKRELIIEFAKFMTNTHHEREAAYALTTLPTRFSAIDVWPSAGSVEVRFEWAPALSGLVEVKVRLREPSEAWWGAGVL